MTPPTIHSECNYFVSCTALSEPSYSFIIAAYEALDQHLLARQLERRAQGLLSMPLVKKSV